MSEADSQVATIEEDEPQQPVAQDSPTPSQGQAEETSQNPQEPQEPVVPPDIQEANNQSVDQNSNQPVDQVPPENNQEQKPPVATENSGLNPFKQLRELANKPDFHFQDDVYPVLLAMTKYDAVKDGKRMSELAAMTADQLKVQPEYTQYRVTNILDLKQKPMEQEYVAALTDQLKEWENEFTGKTPEEVVSTLKEQQAEKEKAILIEKKLAEKKVDEKNPITEEEMDKIVAEGDKEAKVIAEEKTLSMFERMEMVVGAAATKAMKGSSFNDLIDLFVEQSIARGSSWSRAYEGSSDGKRKEMITQNEVMEKLGKKEELIKTLNTFYDELKRNNSFSTLRKPVGLRENFEADKVTKEDLRGVMSELAQFLDKNKDDANSPVLRTFEFAALKTMGKEQTDSVMDDQVFLNLIKIGDTQHPEYFDDFAKHMSDAKQSQSAETTEQKAA